MTDPAIPAAVADATTDARNILTTTHRDAPDGSQLAVVAATKLAAASGAVLYIADRSFATWGDTAHIERGHLARVRDAGDEGAHMVPLMEAALAAGVPDVVALRPSVPDLEGFDQALLESQADVVVVPERLDHAGWWLRHELRKGDVGSIGVLVERAGGRTVVLVSESGTVTLAE